MDVFKLVGSFAIKGVDAATAQIDSVTRTAKAGFGEAERASEKASSGISSHVGRLGSALGTAAKVGIAAVATAGAAAAAGIGKIASSSLQAYAQYEQLVGGVDTLFGESSAQVQAYAAGAFQTAGLSANQYMETVTSFSASLLQGLGGDTAAAAAYADMAVTDMSDNANKMGTSMSSIQDAYQGFAKQNYTMLDNLKLGYGGTAGEMARLVNDSGVLGDAMEVTADTVNDVSFDKMIEAIHVVQDSMGITGTTAKEAASTIEGSVNMSKAAWSNWVTGLASDGADMQDLTAKLVDSVTKAASNIVPRIGVILSTLGQALVDGLPLILEQLKSVMSEQGPPLLESAKQLFMLIAKALIDLAPQILAGIPALVLGLATMLRDNAPMMLESAMQLFSMLGQALVDNGPMIIQMMADALVQLILFIAEHIPEFLDGAITLFVTLASAIAEAAPQILMALATLLVSLLSAIGEKVGEFFAAAAEFMGGILDGIMSIDVGAAFLDVLNGLASSASGVWDDICSAASTAWEGIKSAIMTPINAAKDAVSGAIDAIKGFFDFKFEWPNIPLPHFSIGGSINPVDWITGDNGGAPSIGVEWYAKAMDAGMMLDGPTIFGYDAKAGRLLAGGEAGTETVVGTGSLMDMVRDAAQNGRVADLLEQMLAVLKAFVAAYDPRMQLVTDTGALVGEIAPMIDRELAWRRKAGDR